MGTPMEAGLCQSLSLFSPSLTTLQSKKSFVKTFWVCQCSPTSFPPFLQARVFSCLFQFTHLQKHTNILSNKGTRIAQLTFSLTATKTVVSLVRTWSTYFSNGDHVTTLAPPSTWLSHGTLSDCCCPDNWDTIIKIVYVHNTITSLMYGTKF